MAALCTAKIALLLYSSVIPAGLQQTASTVAIHYCTRQMEVMKSHTTRLNKTENIYSTLEYTQLEYEFFAILRRFHVLLLIFSSVCV